MNRRESDIVSKSGWRYKREHALEDIKEYAKRYIRLLARYHGDRIILNAEDPGEYTFDHLF